MIMRMNNWRKGWIWRGWKWRIHGKRTSKAC